MIFTNDGLIRRTARLAALVAGFSLASAGLAATASAADLTRYSIASSSPTGGFYKLAAGMAKFVNDKSDTLRFTPLATDGSTENCRRVGRGEVKFGMCTTLDLPNAWAGKAPFAAPQSDIRTVGPDFLAIDFYLMVRADSDVKTVADLVGKSFGCGSPASTATQICHSVLEAAGIADKVKIVELPFDQLASQMVNGDLVGMARVMLGHPAAFAQQLNSRIKLRIVDLGKVIDDDKLLEKANSLTPATIPQGTYDFQPAAIRTVSFHSFFITNAAVPDAHIYDLMKIMYSEAMVEHMNTAYRFHGFYPRNKDPLDGLLVPLHPGAAKFWKEVGVTIPKPALVQ